MRTYLILVFSTSGAVFSFALTNSLELWQRGAIAGGILLVGIILAGLLRKPREPEPQATPPETAKKKPVAPKKNSPEMSIGLAFQNSVTFLTWVLWVAVFVALIAFVLYWLAGELSEWGKRHVQQNPSNKITGKLLIGHDYHWQKEKFVNKILEPGIHVIFEVTTDQMFMRWFTKPIRYRIKGDNDTPWITLAVINDEKDVPVTQDGMLQLQILEPRTHVLLYRLLPGK